MIRGKKYIDLIKDTFIFIIGSVGSKLILFIMLPIYTNFLSDAEYGISELVFTSAQLIIPIVSLVIFDGVLRFGLSKDYNCQDVLLNGLLVSLIGSLFTLFITPIIGMYQPLNEWQWYLSIYVILSIFSSVILNYLKATNRNKLFSIISILQTLLMALLNILLIVVFKIGIKGYLLSNIIALFLSVLISFFIPKLYKEIKCAKFNKELFKKMILYSLPLILNNISWWVIHSSDKIMIEIMLGASALGLYTVASKIPSLINVFSSIFSQAWNISVIKEYENDNDNNFYSNIFNIFQFLIFLMVILINLIIKPFMKIYVGPSFFDSWLYIPILMCAAACSAISSYFGCIYSARNKSFNNMITTLLTALINVSLNYILISYIGILGAVIATFISYFILSIIRMIDTRRYIKFDINFCNLFLNYILAIINSFITTYCSKCLLISLIILLIYLINNISTMKKVFATLKRKEKSA